MILICNTTVWKRLIYHGKDLGDYCLVSNKGDIKGVKTGKIRKKNINHEGYFFVSISLGNRNSKQTIKIHRAVAETFINNNNCLPIINHKDGNKLNNNVDNLEWCNHKYNTNHAIVNNLFDPRNTILCKKIVKLNKNNLSLIDVYNSVSDAYRSLNKIYNGAICDCIGGRIKTAYGYKWMYYEDYINNLEIKGVS